jgi:hypothetical protein
MHNGIVYSFKNEGNPAICDMSEPSGTMLSKISQSQKDKQCMIPLG